MIHLHGNPLSRFLRRNISAQARHWVWPDSVGRFFRWWGTQLADCAPGRLRASVAVLTGYRADILLALPLPASQNGQALFLRLIRGARHTALGTYHVDDEREMAALRAVLHRWYGQAALVLHAGEAAVLSRPVTLPLAAEAHLNRVLAHEMDRLTPFPAGAVLWTFDTLQRDRTHEKLSLILHLLPVSLLPPGLAALRAAGYPPRWIEAVQNGRPVRIPFQPAEDDAPLPPRDNGTAKLKAAWALCGILTMLAAATPFIRQSVQLSRTGAAIAEQQDDARTAAALRRTILREHAQNEVLAAAHTRNGDLLTILAMLTELLPDDSFINDLSVAHRAVTMSGQSPAAAKLIASLSAHPGVRNPAFTAPVTRSPDGKADLFAIRMDILPETTP